MGLPQGSPEREALESSSRPAGQGQQACWSSPEALEEGLPQGPPGPGLELALQGPPGGAANRSEQEPR
eukprot:NODE_7163_length_584_cov_7.358879_g6162_i0.p4 GENE.NODE_7163_length_584_cov_7.358879_g6162_i0~~NODE_7163_length_584_cov_7.358879_g6162_i0.p4  ORF type:complete len:68 (-),score=5.46 NODE_7163_length_584_cov_7.358879_g6162_i0:86-289(-)